MITKPGKLVLAGACGVSLSLHKTMSLVARLSSAFGTPEAAQTARRGPKSRRRCFESGLPFHSQNFQIFPDRKLVGRRYDHLLTRASKGAGHLEQPDDPAAFLNKVCIEFLDRAKFSLMFCK
jgi:hypothetical protein